MSKLNSVKYENFTLKKAVIGKESIDCTFEEIRVVDGQSKTVNHKITSNIPPHPDMIKLRDTLRDYLIKAYHLNTGYDLAIKYLKGQQKEKANDALLDMYNLIEVTGISIGGDEQLRGVVISGKIESNNGFKCAMNTPRIVFSSEKLGYEEDVEHQIDLIDIELYKYLFENKKAQLDLFDNDEPKDVPFPDNLEVNDPKTVSSGLE